MNTLFNEDIHIEVKYLMDTGQRDKKNRDSDVAKLSNV